MKTTCDLSALVPHLAADSEGIWRADEASDVDYPDEGNAFCFALEDQSFWFKYRNDFIVHTVSSFAPGGPIVDVGAGNGFVSIALQRAGFDVIAIEPGQAGARNARSRGVRRVICATWEEAALPPQSLGAVGLFDVVEHLEDDLAFLQSVRRALRIGGRLYLTVPALNILWSSEDELVGHHRRYSLKDIGDRLQATGLEIDYSTYVFSPLALPLFLLRSLPSRLGLRRTLVPSRTASELKPEAGLALRAMTRILDAEVSRVKGRRRIPVGTSCLVAAHAAR